MTTPATPAAPVVIPGPHGRGTGEHARGWDAAIETAAAACEKWGQIAKKQGHDDAWPRDLAEFIRYLAGRKDAE